MNLKPCPFCGADETGLCPSGNQRFQYRVREEAIVIPEVKNWPVVVCGNCGAMAPPDIWNDRRAPLINRPDVIAAIESALVDSVIDRQDSRGIAATIANEIAFGSIPHIRIDYGQPA